MTRIGLILCFFHRRRLEHPRTFEQKILATDDTDDTDQKTRMAWTFGALREN
jgi:hypothetical protein